MPFELFGGSSSASSGSTTSIIQTPSSSNIATGAYSPFILNRPQGDFVYSPNANDDTISQFSRNSTTGALTALAPATVACLQTTNNAASAIAPNGSWLYVLDYTTGVVRPFSVNTGTGQLTALATVTCATGNICGIVISSDSAFLYVFSTAGSCIYQFSIAPGTGLLTPLGTPSVAVTGGESNPSNAIYLHSSGMFIYGATALGTWINRWTRNTTTGLLTAAAGTNAGVGFTAEGAGVVGNYLYVGDSIANGRGLRYYAINTGTGALTLNGTYADGDLSSIVTGSADGSYFYNTTSNGLFIKQYLVGASGAPALLNSIAFAGGSLPYGTVIQGSNVYVVNIPTNTIYVYTTTSSSSAALLPDFRTTGPGVLQQPTLGGSVLTAPQHFGTSTGTADTQLLALWVTPWIGQVIEWTAGLSNTGTLTVNGKTVQLKGLNLLANQVVAGEQLRARYDAAGTLQLITQSTVGNYMLCSNILHNGRLRSLQTLVGIASGDVDLIPPVANKRMLLVGSCIYNPTGGTITITAKLKRSGTYYRVLTAGSWATTVVSSTLLGGGSEAKFYVPVLADTDTFAITTSAVGVVPTLYWIEFDNTSPLKSVFVPNLANGNNLIYTSPAGIAAYPTVINNGQIGHYAQCFRMTNDSGAGVTVYWMKVASGGSPVTMGAGSNVMAPSAAVGDTLSNTQSGNPYALPGEAFWINTSSGTAGQNAWLTVLEVPIV